MASFVTSTRISPYRRRRAALDRASGCGTGRRHANDYKRKRLESYLGGGGELTKDLVCTGDPIPSPPDPSYRWVWVETPNYAPYLCNLSWVYGGVCGGDYFDPSWSMGYLP